VDDAAAIINILFEALGEDYTVRVGDRLLVPGVSPASEFLDDLIPFRVHDNLIESIIHGQADKLFTAG
jgi:hypothetical protein